ncbi:hypothetical protein [Natronolimnohabitans innermongolicus]|uniref:hypothetical protein n=1 Tax=Natronolimnohabitans innermongolicus TaxID=253107 RepID=UPI000A5F69CA|nr:hypothetical protein [Natronolimnohabitans innermongolicus]
MGTIGTVTAQNRNGERSRRQIVESFHEDGLEGVKGEFEKQNLDYTVTSTTLEEKQSEESEVTPEYGYDEDESEVQLMLAENSNHPDRIWATASMALEEVDPFADNYDGTDDAIGISFDDDHWSVVGSTSKTVNYPDGVEEEGEISFYSNSLEDGGLAANVDLPVDFYIRGVPYPPETTNVALMTELRNLDGVAGNIFATYVHNGGSGSIDSISGGAGPIDVALSGWDSTENFDIADDDNPDPYM